MSYCVCRDHSRSRFEDALFVQDACNLRAIARLLVRAADEATETAGGTQASYDDAAVILIVNKIESLIRSERDTRYSQAYDRCLRETRP